MISYKDSFEEYYKEGLKVLSKKEANISMVSRPLRSPAISFIIERYADGERVTFVRMFSIKKFGAEKALEMARAEKRSYMSAKAFRS